MLLNPNLVSGVNQINFVAVSGNLLYAADQQDNTIQAFNATTGAPLAGFTTITGLARSAGPLSWAMTSWSPTSPPASSASTTRRRCVMNARVGERP